MNRSQRMESLQQKVKATKEATPALSQGVMNTIKPVAAPAPALKKEGFTELSTMNRAFAIIIYIALALIAAFIAYKFIWPIVARGGKRALNSVKARARGAFRYSK